MKGLTQLIGLFLMTIAITVSSCQAVFQTGSSANVPSQLSPSSFQHER